MTTVTLDQAKDHLEELLAKAAEGEVVVIVRDDGSTFTVVPAPGSSHQRRGRGSEPRSHVRINNGVNEIAEGLEADIENGSTHQGDHAGMSSDTPETDLPANSRGSYGIVRGQIWIAPDFDDIPEGFEPYLGDDEKAV